MVANPCTSSHLASGFGGAASARYAAGVRAADEVLEFHRDVVRHGMLGAIDHRHGELGEVLAALDALGLHDAARHLRAVAAELERQDPENRPVIDIAAEDGYLLDEDVIAAAAR